MFKFNRVPVIAFLHDSMVTVFAFCAAYWLRFNFNPIPPAVLHMALWIFPLYYICHVAASMVFHLYRGLWSYFSLGDVKQIIKASTFGVSIATLIILLVTRFSNVPRTVPLLYVVLLINLLVFSRFLYRLFRERKRGQAAKRVMIIGAGNAGEGIVRDILRNQGQHYTAVMFVDDSAAKIGQHIHGVKIYGPTKHCCTYVKQFKIDLIIVAMPSVTSEVIRKIVRQLEAVDVPVRTLPSLHDLANGLVSMQTLRQISIEDLLGRESHSLPQAFAVECVSQQVVCVTGGGGSIGSELCRQIANLQPKRLIIIDSCEFNLYTIGQNLNEKFPEFELHLHLESITDQARISEVLARYKPSIVFHAAAYKHVPILESQAHVAIHNNVLGTKIVAEACIAQQVKTFVMISTDKAVNPPNVMGASKRIAELICQAFSAQNATRFKIVRFGNVLGSSGSVVPLFKRQILEGNEITVTHPDITRYFMTIPEASQLILQAAAMGEGGEIFVLDMGKPIRIHDLAENMILLSGRKLNEDIRIVYTGLRPGEKLHEELFYKVEHLNKTCNDKIYYTKYPADAFRNILNDVDALLQIPHDDDNLRAAVFALLNHYDNNVTSTDAP